MKTIAAIALSILCLAMPANAMPAGPQIAIDAGTGLVIYERDPDRPWYPASLTKMMTLYVALAMVSRGEASFGATVEMSATATRQAPSRSGLAAGRVLRLDDALRVMMVKSANDVALAIAESLAGDEAAFVSAMNREAAALGMLSSHFVNPNGLHDPLQVTTARDMAILATTLVSSPAAMRLASIHRLRLDDDVFTNGNGLLGRYPGAEGLKTGYLCTSGFNLVTTATRGGRRTIAVVLGHPSAAGRDADAADLLDRSFRPHVETVGLVGSRRMATNAPPVDLSSDLCDPQGFRRASAGDADGIDPGPFLATPRQLDPTVRVVSNGRPALLNVASHRLPSTATSAPPAPTQRPPR